MAEKDDDNSLSMRVAVVVAILATFMGICKVKDDNINQAMQQAQANKVDHWSFYQARNIREEVANSTIVQLKLAKAGRPASEQAAYDEAIAGYINLAEGWQCPTLCPYSNLPRSSSCRSGTA
ncbi:DUF4337 family protein [Pseudoduganella sp. S-14]|jgi:hypothetical protein|uniref:DUF4337 family protein n=1 Tax=Pseudoduganella sp. S-14 TaxID=3404065 RepID=UPI003CF53800